MSKPSKFDFSPSKGSKESVIKSEKESSKITIETKEKIETTSLEEKKTSPVKKDKEVTTLSNLTSPEKKSGRPRLASAVFDQEAAIKIAGDLMKTYPARDLEPLNDEFQKFLEETDDLPDSLPSYVCLFVSGARANGMMLSSCDVIFKQLCQLHPARDQKERQLRYRFGFSLSSARCLEDGAKPFSLSLEDLVLYVDNAETVEVKAFLWLLLSTGCRPHSIWNVPLQSWIFEEDSVGVQWRLQKAQRQRAQRHDAEYFFAWSVKPSREVVEYLEGSTENNWSFNYPNVKSAATSINAKMKTIHDKLKKKTMTEGTKEDDEERIPTSSAFRDRMDQLLRDIKPPLDSEDLKNLLDHTRKTSDAHYSVFAKDSTKRKVK